jgi:hypothetical protein
VSVEPAADVEPVVVSETEAPRSCGAGVPQIDGGLDVEEQRGPP